MSAMIDSKAISVEDNVDFPKMRKNRGSASKTPLEKNSILLSASQQWLHVSQIYFLLDPVTSPLSISKESPQEPPPSGSLILYDRAVTRRYKDDGYRWVKKRNSKKVREDHVKLRIGGVKKVYGSYVHCMDNPNFHRRAYHLIDVDLDGEPTKTKDKKNTQNLILVHYLDTHLASMDISPHESRRRNTIPQIMNIPQLPYNFAPMPQHLNNNFLNTRVLDPHAAGQMWLENGNAFCLNQTLFPQRIMMHPQWVGYDGRNSFNLSLSPQQLNPPGQPHSVETQLFNLNNKRPSIQTNYNSMYALNQVHAAKRRKCLEDAQRPSMANENGEFRYGSQSQDTSETIDDSLSPESFSSLYQLMKDAKEEDFYKCWGNNANIDEGVDQIFSTQKESLQQKPDLNGFTPREAMNFFVL